MKSNSKFTDVNTVLASADKTLEKIEKEYQVALYSQNIPGSLLVDIKSYLGDLKSALDYLNNRIINSDKYFPICTHQNDFVARYASIDNLTRVILERIQPYNGNDWIKWFNVLNNKNKHVTLVPQIRKEQVET